MDVVDVAEEGLLRAVGVLDEGLPDEPDRRELLAMVAAPRRGAQVIRLLAWEERARRSGAGELRVGGSFIGYAWPGVETRQTAALAMLVRHGYRRTGVAFHMAVDVARVEPPSEETLGALGMRGITVRRTRQEDLTDLTRWIRDAFDDVWAEEVGMATARDRCLRTRRRDRRRADARRPR